MHLTKRLPRLARSSVRSSCGFLLVPIICRVAVIASAASFPSRRLSGIVPLAPRRNQPTANKLSVNRTGKDDSGGPNIARRNADPSASSKPIAVITVSASNMTSALPLIDEAKRIPSTRACPNISVGHRLKRNLTRHFASAGPLPWSSASAVTTGFRACPIKAPSGKSSISIRAH